MKCLKTMTLTALALAATLGLNSNLAFADPAKIQNLDHTIQQEIETFQTKLASRKWEATDLYLTIAPSLAFDIPEVVEVKLVPQVTLVWSKEDR